jgi:hypothetical protein
MAHFVVFVESSGPVEPREGALDDPAFWQDLEAFLVGAFDDLQGVPEHLFCPADQLTGVTAVGEDGGDGVEAAKQAHQHRSCRDPVLDAGRVHDRSQQIALRIYRDMPFAAFDLLAGVVAALPPFSAVFADCESTIATVGVAFRPLALRPCSRSILPTRSQTPLSRQIRNCSCTVFQGGRLSGNCRH